MKTKRFLIITLGTTLALAPMAVLAEQESVADAARKAQAAKKTAPKAKMVIDNDNLDTLKGTVSVVGQTPTPPADPTKAAGADKAAVPAPGAPTDQKPIVKDEGYWRKAFAEANKVLAGDAHELDILQREYNLKQQQYYSDPNTAMKEQYNRQDLTDTKAKIDEKTAAVAADKQVISDLEDQLRQVGGDPGWGAPTPAPAPAAQ